ncbi:MAG: M20/M25/M40 family metallo-hydrolase [Candidatus Coatesbacteria bacterium]|nr:M20/M25/M40 family metallo-hydrolase [Candidatus Coatesbacteria bacterium]
MFENGNGKEIGFMVNTDRLLKLFIELCSIPSESKCEREIAEVVSRKTKKLANEIWFDEAHKKFDGNCGNLYIKYNGNVDMPPVLLNAHIDTVPVKGEIVPVIHNGIVKSKGDTILGADDKAGVAVIIEVLNTIIEKQLPCPPLEIVFTVAEEIGLLGAKNMDYSKLNSRYGISLDSAEVEKIVNAAPSQHTLKVEIKGKAAHAAMNPEEGINAISLASRAISMLPWGRIDEETTTNVGKIQGGVATNIIPDSTIIDIEVRSMNNDKLGNFTKQIESVFKDQVEAAWIKNENKIHRADMKFKVNKEYSSFKISSKHRLVKAFLNAGCKLDIAVEPVRIGGGSDANIFNQHGIESVIMGVGMEKYHTSEEFIRISDLNKAAFLLLEALAALSHK